MWQLRNGRYPAHRRMETQRWRTVVFFAAMFAVLSLPFLAYLAGKS